MGRATKTEVNKRITAVYKLLLNGTDRQSIIEFVSKKYNIERAQADNYIATARERIAEQAENQRAGEFELMLSRLDMLLHGALEENDRKTALAILKERALLLNLYPANKSETTLTINNAYEAASDEFEYLVNKAVVKS